MLGSSLLVLILASCPALLRVSASPLDPKAALSLREREDNRCYPDTAGKRFIINLAQLGGNPTGLANLHDAATVDDFRVYLDDVPVTPTSHWVTWYASSQNGDSIPPVEISSGITDGGGRFCIESPTWGSELRANNCSPGEVKQEYVISCESCYSSIDLGNNCQIRSWDWGQCWTSGGQNSVLALKECEAFGTPSQTFNVIQYDGVSA
ncbi:hypothetical protein T439DRAFT_360860 [Meredithblackwellia eburnea MCA 4105]